MSGEARYTAVYALLREHDGDAVHAADTTGTPPTHQINTNKYIDKQQGYIHSLDLCMSSGWIT